MIIRTEPLTTFRTTDESLWESEVCVSVCASVFVHISEATPDLLFLLKAKRLSAGLRLQRQKYDAHFQLFMRKTAKYCAISSSYNFSSSSPSSSSSTSSWGINSACCQENYDPNPKPRVRVRVRKIDQCQYVLLVKHSKGSFFRVAAKSSSQSQSLKKRNSGAFYRVQAWVAPSQS